MRAVVDPNVLVSAWISPYGFPRRILDAADEERFETVVSEKLLGELSDVLMRRRIRRRMRRYGPPDLAEAHVRRAGRVGVRVEVEDDPERIVPDDPKDDYLVALSRLRCRLPGLGRPASGGTSPGEGAVPVLAPRQFSELLKSGSR